MVLFGIIHEKRDESLECLGKCLLVMKMSLLVKKHAAKVGITGLLCQQNMVLLSVLGIIVGIWTAS